MPLGSAVACSSVVATQQEWSVRSVSLHGHRGCLPRRHRPRLGKGESTMNASRYVPFAGRLLIGLGFASMSRHEPESVPVTKQPAQYRFLALSS
jgi:hypothetical protein